MEFLPKKIRGICIVVLEIWWTVGTILAVVLALAVIPNCKSCDLLMIVM